MSIVAIVTMILVAAVQMYQCLFPHRPQSETSLQIEKEITQQLFMVIKKLEYKWEKTDLDKVPLFQIIKDLDLKVETVLRHVEDE